MKNATWLAIGLSLISLFLFDVMGLIIKHLSPRYSAAELSAYRNLIGMVPSALVLAASPAWHATGRQLRIRQWPLAMARGIAVTFAQYAFYLSLGAIAFATATTISYANAIFITALSVPLLGETVGRIRWAAVLIGFVGVILIVGPGRESFTPIAILPVIAAFLYALAAITARMVDKEVPSPLLNLYTQSSAAVGAVLLTLFTSGFSPIQSNSDMAWIVAMGTSGGFAVLCLVYAFRMEDASNLAPFSYFGIPLAFLLGWLAFGEAPWGDLFPGALLIAAGGLLIVWRERRLKARGPQ